jgi:DNA end-binding protein Ku
MKAQWKGHIRLGQLGFPVRLYNATRSLRPKFRLLHDKDGSPVTQTYHCKHDGAMVGRDDLIRAIEYNDGSYVTVTDNELEQTAANKSRIIDITQFVDDGSIEPVHYERPFFIVPSKSGERAYALLREVLNRLKKMAISQFAIYGSEHVSAVGVYGDLLVLNQLRYADEILPRSEIKSPGLPKPSPKEIEALSTLVERHSGPLFIEDYHDEQAERLNELVERKAKGLPAPKIPSLEIETPQDEDLLPFLQDALNEK